MNQLKIRYWTREPKLVCHKCGRYYARTFNNNKEIWKSLRTAHFSVAKVRLAEFLREHREKQVNGLTAASAKMTFGEALRIHQQTRPMMLRSSRAHGSTGINSLSRCSKAGQDWRIGN